MQQSNILGSNILGKYTIDSILGKGKFGQVYKGKRTKDQEIVAIKIESSSEYKILKHETTMLNYLHGHGSKQIPTVFWYGIFEKCPTLVMTYYQNSLDDYVKHKSISQEKLNTIMMLLLEILENVHTQYVIHRDIKPQNIMMKNGELFLIDFGLSTFYVDENFKHVDSNHGKDYIIGTPKYISYNIHNGQEPSRRDDLISLGYLYLNIVFGDLPWSNMSKTHNNCLSQSNNIQSNNIQSSNAVDSHINQERKQLKSWKNIEVMLETCDSKIINYMKRCYQLEYKDINYLF